MADSLATVADLSAYLQEALADDDASALFYLKSASGQVRDYLQQQVTQVTDDVIIVDPLDNLSVFLPEMPVTAVTTVETLVEGVWTVMDPSTYTASLITGQVSAVADLWPSTPGSWRITYTHGFAEVPDGLVGVVVAVAARGYSTPVGVDNERIGQRSIKYSTRSAEFSESELATLDRYSLARVG